MLAFEIPTPTQVKLDHAKGRKENHGDVKVLAIDLSITFATNNRFLDTFAPGWREALFCALPPGSEAPADQSTMDLRVSDLPFLRMPNAIYPIKLDKEFSGTLRMDYGRGGDADKVLNTCKLKSFQITPIEGGSVEIHFAASTSADVTGEMVGVFSEYIQQNIAISIIAPKDEQGRLIDASKDGDAPKAKSKKTKDAAQADAATEGFLDAHGAGAPPDGAAEQSTDAPPPAAAGDGAPAVTH